MTRINGDMIGKLGIAMLEIGFTLDDVKIALNAIMHNFTLEVIANIPLRKEAEN